MSIKKKKKNVKNLQAKRGTFIKINILEILVLDKLRFFGYK